MQLSDGQLPLAQLVEHQSSGKPLLMLTQELSAIHEPPEGWGSRGSEGTARGAEGSGEREVEALSSGAVGGDLDDVGAVDLELLAGPGVLPRHPTNLVKQMGTDLAGVSPDEDLDLGWFVVTLDLDRRNT